MLDARFPYRLVYDSKLIRGKITQTLIVVRQVFQDTSPGILVAPIPPPEEVRANGNSDTRPSSCVLFARPNTQLAVSCLLAHLFRIGSDDRLLTPEFLRALI